MFACCSRFQVEPGAGAKGDSGASFQPKKQFSFAWVPAGAKGSSNPLPGDTKPAANSTEEWEPVREPPQSNSNNNVGRMAQHKKSKEKEKRKSNLELFKEELKM
jgi:hypothetical protein